MAAPLLFRQKVKCMHLPLLLFTFHCICDNINNNFFAD